MPKGKVSIEIEAPCERVFDLIHDYQRRLQWDSMLSDARILGGAAAAAKGVRTRCTGRWRTGRIAMDTVYVNFERPGVAAVKLVNRPPFFATFSATIRHVPITETRSRVIYIYSFHARPRCLAFALEPMMQAALRKETARRLECLRAHLEGDTEKNTA